MSEELHIPGLQIICFYLNFLIALRTKPEWSVNPQTGVMNGFIESTRI
jgi:hypothetical protein